MLRSATHSAVLDGIRQQLRADSGHLASTGQLSPDKAFLGVLKARTDDWQVVRKPDDRRWRDQQWYNAFEVLFWEDSVHSRDQPHADDLLFLVLKQPNKNSEPFLLRRKESSPPEEFRPASPDHNLINWQETVLLNLALQTPYCLSAVICRREDLAQDLSQQDRTRSGTVRSADVFASPSRVSVHGRKRFREEVMAPSYPDICYSLDESHTGFDDLVLREEGQCLHVQLEACEGILPGPPTGESSQAHKAGSHDQKPQPVVLLSGFVSHEQLAEALQKHASIWRAKDRELIINMKGPGGRGAALVATQALKPAEDAHIDEKASNLIQGLKLFAKNLLPGQRQPVQIRCAMLEVNMPVAVLASRLLGIEV